MKSKEGSETKAERVLVAYSAKFWIMRPGTRWNSRGLLVTRIEFVLNACAAIDIS